MKGMSPLQHWRFEDTAGYHDKPGRWLRRSGAGMSTRKCLRNARTGTSMVWCAMDSQQQTFMQQNLQACVPSFGCASMPGGQVWKFPNLGVNPMSCQGNMLIGPVGTSLGGLTPQAAQT